LTRTRTVLVEADDREEAARQAASERWVWAEERANQPCEQISLECPPERTTEAALSPQQKDALREQRRCQV
jgi:hypothetical protein